jgi:hypothetical protein
MKELAGLLFSSGETAHKIHLQTKSYAAHKALNEYYDEITDLTDKLVEAYQGKFGLVGSYEVSISDEKSPVKYLTSVVDEVELNRYTWLDEKDTYLQNIIDEIVGLLYSTLYKLKYLM